MVATIVPGLFSKSTERWFDIEIELEELRARIKELEKERESLN